MAWLGRRWCGRARHRKRELLGPGSRPHRGRARQRSPPRRQTPSRRDLEARAQDEALRAARESQRIAINQYQAGALSYLNVVVSQSAALNAERAAITIQSRRLTAAVDLITAMGGGL